MAEFHEEEFEGSVEVEDGRSFFLVRIPKNINITQLNNVRIKKMKASNDIDALKGDGGSTYSLQIGPDVGLSNFRPIVSEDGKAAVGPKFAGCLTVTRKFALQQSEDAVPCNAYKPKAQVSNLRLPTPPIGSSTAKEVLHKRLATRNAANAKRSESASTKKRKADAEEEEEAVVESAEDKSSKKKKKEKSR